MQRQDQCQIGPGIIINNGINNNTIICGFRVKEIQI